ncbi:hypothetical protein LWI29_010888 [Acer saccharum]|uniref:SLC26A/SulP transporter domain-containing protein n=1 Tax=Acer saccharum TaxID=4024 RepID=A0AA39RLC3_ACESA|nr:hypothetical protein LWI29_010888 [Acer saccharum]
MGSLSTEALSVEEQQQQQQQVDMEDSSRAERAQWLLNSPDPPSLWQELVGSIRETLFHGNKKEKKKKQTSSRGGAFSFLKGLFPILNWGRNYKASKFKSDLMAGLTLASLSIPQSIGYANLAKLDPQYGLYTSFVPPLIYALMGSSRELAIGPVAVVSMLLSSLIQKVEDPVADPIAYRKLVFTVTFFAGIFQFVFGMFRLGFLVDFLSHAVIVGFMAGAAIVIGLQQLKGLLVVSSEFRPWLFIPYLPPCCKVYWEKKQKAVLVASNCSTYISNIVNFYSFKGPLLGQTVKIGLITAIVALTEAIAVGRSFASIKGYHLDGNKEMVAMGFMNLVGSLTSCYVATGSFS